MNKVLANLFLLVAGISVQLASYWYVFGLWPRDWTLFVTFSVIGAVLLVLRMEIEKENRACPRCGYPGSHDKPRQHV